MKRSLLVVMCLVCAGFVAGPATATTLTLDYLIGTVAPDTPANPANELIYSNALITWYNGGTNPNGGGTYVYTLGPDASFVPGSPGSGSLLAATGGVSAGTVINGVLTGPVDVTGYTYLMAKFGPDGALYYLNGITSLDGFNPAWGPFTSQEGFGLSGITLFGPGTPSVPEAGALLLFGTGLIGLVGYRRMRRMR